MGGTYEISSNPGKGTSILIIVPLNSNLDYKTFIYDQGTYCR